MFVKLLKVTALALVTANVQYTEAGVLKKIFGGEDKEEAVKTQDKSFSNDSKESQDKSEEKQVKEEAVTDNLASETTEASESDDNKDIEKEETASFSTKSSVKEIISINSDKLFKTKDEKDVVVKFTSKGKTITVDKDAIMPLYQKMGGMFAKMGLSEENGFSHLSIQMLKQFVILKGLMDKDFHKKTDVQNKLKSIVMEALIQLYMSELISKKSSDQTVLDHYYKKYTEIIEKTQEYRIARITVKTKEEAKKILDELKNKEDFSVLAEKHSVVKGKYKNGDEGYTIVDLLPPELKTQLQAFNVGDVSTEAIEMGEYFHIVKLLDKRKTKAKSLDEVKQGFAMLIANDSSNELTSEIDDPKAQIELVKIDGTKMTSEQTKETLKLINADKDRAASEFFMVIHATTEQQQAQREAQQEAQKEAAKAA